MTGRAALLITPVLAAVLVAACAPGVPRTTFPPIGSTPQPAGDATAATRKAVVDALAAAGLQALEAPRAYRPPEGALLAAAPRSVLQVTLPDDPTHGYIVIYALGSPAAATAAAKDHAAYVASGIGKSLYPFATRHIVRVVNSTVVFFHWSPETSTDDRAAQIADVLATVGAAVEVPG